jgi:DNA-binding transcriptional ArsR family regulator
VNEPSRDFERGRRLGEKHGYERAKAEMAAKSGRTRSAKVKAQRQQPAEEAPLELFRPDPSTGAFEPVTGPLVYPDPSSGKEIDLSRWPGITPTDVAALEPACTNDYAQVCRPLVSNAMQRLAGAHLPASILGLWLWCVVEADPDTGLLDKSQSEIARVFGVSQPTAREWIRKLAGLGQIEAAYRDGSPNGAIRVLHYDEVVKLGTEQLIEQRYRALRRRRVVERETIRERIVDEEYDP